jgi:hypothetical protein
MSQSSYSIGNVSRTLIRAFINESAQALASLSSGATAPATTYAYMLWADTSAGLLKQRSAANDAWIVKGSLADENWGFITDDVDNTFTGLITMSGKAIIEAEGAAVASAATTDIWAGDGNTVHVTGTTGITSFGTAPQAGAWMKVIFDAALTLTQSTNLNLNGGGADITVAAGDVAFVYADTTSQLDVFVTRKSGQPVITPDTGFASGTRMLFQQTAAPTGWTKETDSAYDDSILRIVTSTAGNGGSQAFSTFNALTTTSAHTLTTAQIPSHTHTYTGIGTGSAGNAKGGIAAGSTTRTTNAQGGGGSHSHGLSIDIKYRDIIIAEKD